MVETQKGSDKIIVELNNLVGRDIQEIKKLKKEIRVLKYGLDEANRELFNLAKVCINKKVPT